MCIPVFVNSLANIIQIIIISRLIIYKKMTHIDILSTLYVSFTKMLVCKPRRDAFAILLFTNHIHRERFITSQSTFKSHLALLVLYTNIYIWWIDETVSLEKLWQDARSSSEPVTPSPVQQYTSPSQYIKCALLIFMHSNENNSKFSRDAVKRTTRKLFDSSLCVRKMSIRRL